MRMLFYVFVGLGLVLDFSNLAWAARSAFGKYSSPILIVPLFFYLAATLLGGFEGFLSVGCFFLSMLVFHVFCSQASYPVMKLLAERLRAG